MIKQFRHLCVIGLGYIGLPTAAVFAANGLKVTGIDIRPDVVEKVNAGQTHFGEPDLDVLLKQVVDQKHLSASLNVVPADVFIIAVPTPFKKDETQEKIPDMSYVDKAARSIAPVLKKGNLVILESTSPVGSCDEISLVLSELRPDLTFPHQRGEEADIFIAHCPERVLPGQILYEVVHNARIIGGMSRKCAQKALSFYKIIAKGDCHLTNARTAEMAKLTENAFRDVNIAFANELSMICDDLSIDVWELIKMANLHPRVNILQPGPGVGGHCIAVDPWFIVSKSPEKARLIRTAREVNDQKPHHIVKKIMATAESFSEPKILFLGLSYKADVDDMRESPAVEIVAHVADSLKTKKAKLYAAEPHIDLLPDFLAGKNVELIDTEKGLQKADIIVLLVDHRSFLNISFADIGGKIVVDTRGKL